MSETTDPIRRASELPPPTIAEAIVLHIFSELVAEKPKRLERVCRRARDKATAAKVIALHGKTGDPEWEAAFTGAEIRLESVAAMIRADAPAPKRSKRRKKR